MQPVSPQRTLKEYAGLTARGLLIGAADVVPGVSGGTMAFILGIYDELINAIRSVVPFLRSLAQGRWREAFEILPWRFLLAVGLGVGLSIISLAGFLEWALEEHPDYVYALFFGLIVASLFVVQRRVKRWGAGSAAGAALAAVGAYILVGLTPAETPNDLWFVFLSGAVAICAMILPGISGAFILLLLGKYQFMLGALRAVDVPVIVVFMAGAAVGIVSFSNVLRWLLDHYHDLTVAILLGFMLGSLRKVWPWKEYQVISPTFSLEINILPPAFTAEVGIALGLMAVGILIIAVVEIYALRKQRS